MQDFKGFPKIGRLNRTIIVTEKIDGTNAQIVVNDEGTGIVGVGSRNRWITPENDNMGFAKWVEANKEELITLGPGQHFGEWWGQGIQSGYGLKEKRFSLFNVSRWRDSRPACCHVVPTLYEGLYGEAHIKAALEGLRANGSVAAPGFMRPEGVIVFHVANGALFKVTLEGDEKPKGSKEPG